MGMGLNVAGSDGSGTGCLAHTRFEFIIYLVLKEKAFLGIPAKKTFKKSLLSGWPKFPNY
jgi:hypothetical protein